MTEIEHEATPSYVHRNRGRCCKCSCLHCPYGHTVATLGFKVVDVDDESIGEIQECLSANQSTGVAAMLLSQAFKSEKTYEINAQNMGLYKRVFLKDHLCGCLYLDNDEKKLFLLPSFQDQEIKLEDVLIYVS